MGKRRSLSQNITTIIISVVGVVGTIAVAYFSFRGNIAPLQLSIATTLTAESRVPMSTALPTITPTLSKVVTILPTTLFAFDFDTGISPWQSRGLVNSILGQIGKGVIVTSDKSGKSELWYDFPRTYFREGKTYRISAWYKAEKNTSCTLIFMASMGGPPYKDVTIKGDSDWQRISLEIVTTPVTDMTLFLDGNTNQKLQDGPSDSPCIYDNVEITEILP